MPKKKDKKPGKRWAKGHAKQAERGHVPPGQAKKDEPPGQAKKRAGTPGDKVTVDLGTEGPYKVTIAELSRQLDDAHDKAEQWRLFAIIAAIVAVGAVLMLAL
jgi:hypothetical protein